MDFEKDILNELLKNPNITDISFNGKDIYIQDNKRGRYKLEEEIDPDIVENYVKQLTYQNNRQFNDEEPILDTEFPKLRINAVHKSLAPYGLTLSLRSSQAELKIRKFQKDIAPLSVFSFLEACIKAKCNILISGKTGSGKTEMQKYLVGFIPDNDKIILIEDTLDTHLKEIYKDKDILSWQTNNKLEKTIGFDELLKAGLRNNPDWIIVSETRGSEAYTMLKSILSGHHIITTLHSSNAKSNVERIIHMCKEKYQLDQNLLGTMICDNFDIGIHLDHKVDSDGVKRYVAEVVEYVAYTDKGAIINTIYKRNVNIAKVNNGYEYTVSYKFGKMTKKLFDKLIAYEVLNSDIEKFMKEEYFGGKNYSHYKEHKQ